MIKKLLIAAIIILVLILLLFGTYKLSKSRTFQLFGDLTHRVETDEKLVALTFDDGPTENIQDVLPLLEKYNAKTTFFVNGKALEENPELGKEIVAAGHDLGNHTYSHEQMVLKSPSFIKKEVESTTKLIRNTGYEGEIDFRPPFGKKLFGLPFYLNKIGMETIMWDVEPDTYASTSNDKIQYVIEHVQPGSIILFHPMYDDSEKVVETLKGILRHLTEEGYEVVTVNTLQQ
ncbi:polysaccharide deacetylase family protein [Pontibacillus yanchengensis]|uniref:Polysaccharide deacetylase n=1 Tax=Pontibacillus yanchengensis Y32 TaxID=1385514 RepID=A0A0A2TTT6_9BACI|nr:polysaccharide deacetylase family protein [Pontibacillus yanchengensis]KGP72685.1 polysaccharide deacetylase [Pontibacillus yanchengensis Y32]